MSQEFWPLRAGAQSNTARSASSCFAYPRCLLRVLRGEPLLANDARPQAAGVVQAARSTNDVKPTNPVPPPPGHASPRRRGRRADRSILPSADTRLGPPAPPAGASGAYPTSPATRAGRPAAGRRNGRSPRPRRCWRCARTPPGRARRLARPGTPPHRRRPPRWCRRPRPAPRRSDRLAAAQDQAARLAAGQRRQRHVGARQLGRRRQVVRLIQRARPPPRWRTGCRRARRPARGRPRDGG